MGQVAPTSRLSQPLQVVPNLTGEGGAPAAQPSRLSHSMVLLMMTGVRLICM